VPKAVGRPWLGTDCFYRGTDGHIHRLHRESGAWRHENLTARLEAPLGGFDPEGVTDERGDHVIYVGTDGHVHELYRLADFQHTDLTSIVPGAPLAQGLLDRYIWHGPHILFRDTEDIIQELAYVNGVWRIWPATDKQNRCASDLGTPRCLLHAVNGVWTQLIYYCDREGVIHELLWQENKWRHSRVRSPRSLGAPHACVTTKGITIFLRDREGHVHSTVRDADGDWSATELWKP
jgi:hypothetical protein